MRGVSIMSGSITRRQVLAGAMATGALHIQPSAFAITRPRHKNVLLLISDDHGKDMASYGNPVVQTPHLDSFAQEGIRFTNAFCTTPSCSASRSVIFTGMHNHRNGHFGHAHDYHHFSLFEWVQPLPRMLKQSGYTTGLIGKFHVNPASAFAWDYLPPGRDYGGSRNVTRMAEAARGFFRENRDNPFFLTIGYSDPHRAGKGFGNEENRSDLDPVRYSPDDVIVPPFLPDTPEVREELADYYESVSRMDAGVGMVLDALRETGLEDSTLAIYISDNGIPFPGAKTCVYDAGINLPMLVRSPEQSKPGFVNEAMVSFTDLTPTILDWTNTPLPEYQLDGHTFLPYLEEKRPDGWDAVFFSHTFHEITMYYPSRGIRTRQYKYIHNLAHHLPFPFASDLYASKTWQGVMRNDLKSFGERTVQDYIWRPEEELYDIINDPYESNNLAGKRNYREIQALLRARTDGFRQRTEDPWRILDNYTFPPPR